MKHLPSISVNEWKAALLSLKKQEEDPIPQGFISHEEASVKLGIHVRHAYKILDRLIAAGKAERIRIKRLTPVGKLKNAPFYRLK